MNNVLKVGSSLTYKFFFFRANKVKYESQFRVGPCKYE